MASERLKRRTAEVSLQLQNEELTLKLLEAEQMVEALRANEVDAVTENAGQVPILLRAAQHKLRGSEQMFRGVFDGVHDALLLIETTSGRCVDANPAACRLFGRPRERLLGADPSVFYEWGASSVTRPDGSVRHVELLSKEEIQPGLRLAILHDVTERKGLEEQVRLAQKMEAVGVLAGGVAHDFNNILSVILTYASLLQQDQLSTGDQQEYATEIRKAAERAADLTRQLLAFSRSQMLQPTSIQLDAVIGSIEKLMRRLVPESVEVRCSYNSGKCVRADASQMQQVVMNLVVNARDAMPDGGKLTLETSNVTVDAELTAQHLGLTPGPYIKLSVTDTGGGIAPEIRDRIFEPFFTTKALGKGTGLGLATVFGIVKQSGGHIALRTEVGEGTTFEVYLPVTREMPQVAASRSVPPPTLRGSETILLVEDDTQVRTLAQTILSRAGYDVLVAEDGSGALTTYEHHGAKIQLVLTDMVMPGVSGKQLAARINETRPDLPVLFMSGYAEDVEGDMAFLPKPLTRDVLLARVRSVLDAI